MEGTAEAGASPARSDPDTLFRKFNDYPWVKDRQFLVSLKERGALRATAKSPSNKGARPVDTHSSSQQGLAAMLGTLVPSADMDRATSICLQARIWWFEGRLGEQVDPAAYAAYLAANPSAPRPDPPVLARIEDIQRRLGVAGAAGDGSGVPSWQAHAPTADLAVKALDGAARGAAGEGDQDAPYPEHFKAVIEAVTLGKPVPGVREIPSTVIRQPVSAMARSSLSSLSSLSFDVGSGRILSPYL